MRPTIVAATASTLAVAAIAAGLLLTGGDAGGQDADGDDDRADGASAPTTAPVTRRDLTEREELTGTLGYGESRQLALVGAGTLTDLADEGAVVDRGGALAEVDGEPILLLLGEQAMWRALDAGAGDGDDIAQLEENLLAMGFGTAEDLGPDADWTSATTAAVKDWQASLGIEETGRLEQASVVFSPTPVRIATHDAEVGAPASGATITVTGTARIVTIDMDATDQGLLEPGQEVEVGLPDGTTVDGVVDSVAEVVDPPEQDGGSATVEVVVTLLDPEASGTVDQAPVDVDVVTVAVEDALTVPVEALLALAEGGYAVERPDGSLVAVQVGAFADGFVEVTGDVAEGDEVVVAG
jgi:hypothetical protein